MRIGELAAAAGVNVQTVRYYERRGMLGDTTRTSGGFREYPREAVDVIRFVKRAQELGFALVEIESLLRLRAAKAARSDVRALVSAKRGVVESKIRELKAIRAALDRLVASCAAGGGPGCPILRALGGEREDGPADA